MYSKAKKDEPTLNGKNIYFGSYEYDLYLRFWNLMQKDFTWKSNPEDALFFCLSFLPHVLDMFRKPPTLSLSVPSEEQKTKPKICERVDWRNAWRMIVECMWYFFVWIVSGCLFFFPSCATGEFQISRGSDARDFHASCRNARSPKLCRVGFGIVLYIQHCWENRLEVCVWCPMISPESQ